jgi:hypothetical protein
VRADESGPGGGPAQLGGAGAPGPGAAQGPDVAQVASDISQEAGEEKRRGAPTSASALRRIRKSRPSAPAAPAAPASLPPPCP